MEVITKAHRVLLHSHKVKIFDKEFVNRKNPRNGQINKWVLILTSLEIFPKFSK